MTNPGAWVLAKRLNRGTLVVELARARYRHARARYRQFSPLQAAEVLVSVRAGLAQDPFDASVLGPATATLREALAAALASAPRSAADQRIAVPIPCKCELCATLRTFLGSSERELVWPLSAERRQHVTDSLRGACLPVDAAVRKVGSPHKLMLTKRTLELARVEKERRAAMARALSALQ